MIGREFQLSNTSIQTTDSYTNMQKICFFDAFDVGDQKKQYKYQVFQLDKTDYDSLSDNAQIFACYQFSNVEVLSIADEQDTYIYFVLKPGQPLSQVKPSSTAEVLSWVKPILFIVNMLQQLNVQFDVNQLVQTCDQKIVYQFTPKQCLDALVHTHPVVLSLIDRLVNASDLLQKALDKCTLDEHDMNLQAVQYQIEQMRTPNMQARENYFAQILSCAQFQIGNEDKIALEQVQQISNLNEDSIIIHDQYTYSNFKTLHYQNQFHIDTNVAAKSNVYLAEQNDGNKKVAVAIKFQNLTNMPEKVIEKAKFEIQLTGLNHPNCVKILNGFMLKFQEVQYAVTVMERGHRLKDFARSPNFIKNEWKNKLKLVRQLIEGVIYLHSINVLHRDLKPENLLVHQDQDSCVQITVQVQKTVEDKQVTENIQVTTPDADREWQLIIIDFNTARYYFKGEKPPQTAHGTQGYTAPEVMSDKQSQCMESDNYSIGAIARDVFTMEFSEKSFELLAEQPFAVQLFVQQLCMLVPSERMDLEVARQFIQILEQQNQQSQLLEQLSSDLMKKSKYSKDDIVRIVKSCMK